MYTKYTDPHEEVGKQRTPPKIRWPPQRLLFTCVKVNFLTFSLSLPHERKLFTDMLKKDNVAYKLK